MSLNLDGEGFLLNRDDWTPEIAKEIAAKDGRELTEAHMGYILAARAMFDDDGIVPALRNFCKAQDISKADLYTAFEASPIKLICKWGGLPKPTGCV